LKIKGFFSNLKSANKAIEELKKEGFKNAYLDANDHYIGNRNVQTNLPGADGAGSLSDLVINSGSNNIERDEAPLAAANPMVSGMGNFEEITDINCSVVVETDGTNSTKAEEIIKNMGGMTDDPNVSRNKEISKADIDFGEITKNTRKY